MDITNTLKRMVQNDRLSFFILIFALRIRNYHYCMAKKNLSVETLRGIAILLVVVGHVIGSGPGGGMKIDFPHPLRYLYVWIDFTVNTNSFC